MKLVFGVRSHFPETDLIDPCSTNLLHREELKLLRNSVYLA